jgi:hypothetical protein
MAPVDRDAWARESVHIHDDTRARTQVVLAQLNTAEVLQSGPFGLYLYGFSPRQPQLLDLQFMLPTPSA